jgi:hypothetical protein
MVISCRYDYMKRMLILIASIVFIEGCGEKFNPTVFFDKVIFTQIADTIFEKPKIVGFKEIHLSNDFFTDKLVQVKGNVVEKGDLGTFIILGEGDDRLIVATTDLVREFRQRIYIGHSISVLGTVETGKKGMPFLRAQSIKLN